MEIKRQSVAFNILRNFKETEHIMTVENVVNTINDNFNKGLIDELTTEQAFEQLDNLLEKGHKYYKREGGPGNYKYYYTEAEYKKKVGGKKTEGISKESRSESKNIRVGQEVEIPSGLTTDPLHKQGESGKVVLTNEYITTVKFSDGSTGRYSTDIFEDVKSNKDKAQYDKEKGKKIEGKGTEGKGSSETIEKDGKKYKLQSNGKYLEVSKQGLTKEGHTYQSNYSKEMSERPSLHTSKHEDSEKWHKTEASKLSDKEFTKEELTKESHKKESSSFDWNSKDAKILAKHGVTKDNLVVKGDLSLMDTSITSLPENLKVSGYLDLIDTPITSLPENLKVGGNLSLRNTQITSLPENLEVGGSLDLRGTSIT
ncbi:MAG: hypothetical protein WC973_03700, partial [Candidatus Dojkabacteria bacterium]